MTSRQTHKTPWYVSCGAVEGAIPRGEGARTWGQFALFCFLVSNSMIIGLSRWVSW